MVLDTLIDLIGTMSVVVVVAYIVTRSSMYEAIIENRMTWVHKTAVILLFGLFSIYGTFRGVKAMGAFANIRDLGPVIAGLIGGPLVGSLAGMIGAGHRYLQGGFTAVSCSLSTMAAGLIAGLYHKARKGEIPGVLPAVLFMVGIEILHMTLNLLFSKPFEQALALVEQIMVPMVATNAIGIGLFAFIIGNLKREKAVESAKLTLEGELKAAREIQMGILPRTFPPFPDRPEIDLYALIEPAKEVGGDFYDFFWIDNQRLCLVIGDVSGKGVPASLFMAVTKTLIKIRAMGGLPPDRILTTVNDELSCDNPSAMFATVFCAIMNTQTGELTYANGGHNPPYIISSDSRILPLAAPSAPMVGALDGVIYRCEEMKLRPGDAIFLYTDGVSEAMDKAEHFFSTGRIEEALRAASEQQARDAVGGVMAKVAAFCNGAEQSDDITMMMIRRVGTRQANRCGWPPAAD
ncbi:MAG TPA: SpoIIE family protein phosphatase [Geobacteraceae bacterium]